MHASTVIRKLHALFTTPHAISVKWEQTNFDNKGPSITTKIYQIYVAHENDYFGPNFFTGPTLTNAYHIAHETITAYFSDASKSRLADKQDTSTPY